MFTLLSSVPIVCLLWKRILIVNTKNIMVNNKSLSLIINKLFIIRDDRVLKNQNV